MVKYLFYEGFRENPNHSNSALLQKILEYIKYENKTSLHNFKTPEIAQQCVPVLNGLMMFVRAAATLCEKRVVKYHSTKNNETYSFGLVKIIPFNTSVQIECCGCTASDVIGLLYKLYIAHPFDANYVIEKNL